MTVYLPGQRVILVHTSDPHTRLRPGALGTVRSHDQQSNTVAVAWNDGSTLSMLLDDGDRITLTSDAAANAAVAADDEHPVAGDAPAHGSEPPVPPAADSDAVTHVTELPPCDIHRHLRDTVVPARYDGATRLGPWAFMCDGCFTAYGLGLGLGRGQRLILSRQTDTGTAADGTPD